MAERKPQTPHLGDALVPLASLFSDFKLCRNFTTKDRGSYSPHPEGYIFLGGLRGPKKNEGSVQYHDRDTYFLYGKPTELFRKTVTPWLVEGPLQSAEIIPWLHAGKALVLGRDRIASPWVAFIALDDLPDTTNVEVFK